nr:hypothetical protein [uncultured Albidiferax sp.]
MGVSSYHNRSSKTTQARFHTEVDWCMPRPAVHQLVALGDLFQRVQTGSLRRPKK